MQNSLISVILPTYNGKKERISQAIESVLTQSYKNIELIIINDASTNDIEKTILKYKSKDSRIIYIKNVKNLKLTKTLNKGLSIAKGKYIARIDDDDIRINMDKLEKQVNFMENSPEYGLCGAGKVIYIDEEGKTINTMNMRLSDIEIRNSILQSNQFAHSSILLKKSILNEVGNYNPKYNKAEDYELWLRIGTKSKFTNLNDIELKYRINTNGISINNSFYQKRLTFKICINYRKHYPNFYRALILRIGDFILPGKATRYILKIIKGRGVKF